MYSFSPRIVGVLFLPRTVGVSWLLNILTGASVTQGLSAGTSLHAATLRKELLIKLAIS